MTDLWLYVPALTTIGLFVVLPALIIHAVQLRHDARRYDQLADHLEHELSEAA